MPTAGTVSKQTFRINIMSKGVVLINLYRHLSPSTLTYINRIVPFETHAIRQNGMIVLPSSVISGREKGREEFNRGDVAYGLQEGAIVIFLETVRSNRKYNVLGEVENGLEIFDNIVHSETAKVERV